MLRDGAAEEPFFGWSGLTRAIELTLQAHGPAAGANPEETETEVER
ncbi:MAG TPA: hypothetical protein VF731_03080 [Solirubrobacterales bacterium]